MKKTLILIIISILVCSPLISKTSENERPKVALVLSGGGARGFAHIALLEALEKKGIPIDGVFGTSMGGLLGALYAVGYSPADIRNLIKSNNLMKLVTQTKESKYIKTPTPFDFSTPSFFSLAFDDIGIGDTGAIIDDTDILKLFRSSLSRIPDDVDFDDLKIPFRCVAANILTGEEIIFDKGSLVDALRATMSIPIVFEPYEIRDGEYAIDGGFVDNMPVKLAKEMGYDIIIAEDINLSEKKTAKHLESISGVVGCILHLIIQQNIEDSYDLTDVLLSPEVSDYSTFDYINVDEIIQKGEEEVAIHETDLDSIANLFSESQKQYKDPSRVGSYFSLPLIENDNSFDLNLSEIESIKRKSRIDFNLSGGVGLAYIPVFKNWFVRTNFNLGAELLLSKISNSHWELFSKLEYGDSLHYNFGANYYLNKFNLPDFSLYSNMGIDLGSLTPFSSSSNPLPVNLTDIGVDFLTFALNYRKGENFFTSIAMSHFSIMYISSINKDNPLDTDYRFLYRPCLSLSALWGNRFGRLPSFDSYRIDGQIKIGYFDHKLVYSLGASALKSFSISKNFYICASGLAISNRGPECLMSSYFNVGNWMGIPGYAINSLYEDVILLGTDFIFQKDIIFPLKFILSTKIGFLPEKSAFERYNSTTGISSSYFTDVPFGNLDTYDIGFGFGVGLETPIIDLLVGIGFSISGKVGIYIEAL